MARRERCQIIVRKWLLGNGRRQGWSALIRALGKSHSNISQCGTGLKAINKVLAQKTRLTKVDEETRYCFVYGQFLAVIVLGVAFVERALAAEFYSSGRDDLERENISVLLREARHAGWLNAAEYSALDRARQIRNPVTHFRRPGH